MAPEPRGHAQTSREATLKLKVHRAIAALVLSVPASLVLSGLYAPVAAEPEADGESNVALEAAPPLWGFVDRGGELVIPAQYEEAESFSEGLALVRKNGLYGFIDRTGREAIAPAYDFAASFHDGLARADLRGRQYFIDASGRRVFELRVADNGANNDGFRRYVRFSNGRLRIQDPRSGRHYFLDPRGRAAFEQTFQQAYEFSEGLAGVCERDRCGYIDVDGKLVVPLQYAAVASFSEGLAFVSGAEKQGFIDPTGAFAFELEREFSLFAVNRFSEGLVKITQTRVIAPGRASIKFGYYDRQGKPVIPFKFESYFAEDQYANFSHGLSIFVNNGQIGYFDRYGDEVIDADFVDARPFSEGSALVQIRSESGDLFGYLDLDGRFFIEPSYTDGRSFSEGLAAVRVGR